MADCDIPIVARRFPASYKGAPFEIEETSDEFGRRAAEYEFPLDDGAIKDMGKKLRRFSVTGYVIGDNQIARTAACVLAAESPEPGPLLHPLFGVQIVLCTSLRVSADYRKEGRVTRLEWDFVEGLPSWAPFILGVAIGMIFSSGSKATHTSYKTGNRRWAGTDAQKSGTTRVSQRTRTKLNKTETASFNLELNRDQRDARDSNDRALRVTRQTTVQEQEINEALIDINPSENDEALLDAQSLLDRGLYNSNVYREFEQAAFPMENASAQVRLNFDDAMLRFKLINRDVIDEVRQTPTLEPLAVTSRLAIARDAGLAALQDNYETVRDALDDLDFVRKIYDEEEIIAQRNCDDELVEDIAAARGELTREMFNRSVRLPAVVTFDAKGEWPSLVSSQNIYHSGRNWEKLEAYNPNSSPFRMAKLLSGPTSVISEARI